jgi:hypothetical protein
MHTREGRLFAPVITVVSLAISCASFGASTFYVDAGVVGGNGTSWTSAFASLQSALAVATSGDEVHVAQGTFLPTLTTDRSISFLIPSGVAVIGGFRGVSGGRGDPNERDPLAFPTVLSGAIGSAAATDNSYSVVRLATGASAVLLDGLVIEQGEATGAGNSKGGGIRGDVSSVTIRACSVRLNRAWTSGCGVSVVGNFAVEGCTFLDNTSGVLTPAGAGGAIAVEGGSLSVVDSLFAGNSNASGGHVSVTGGVCTFSRSTFADGHALGTGDASAGGIRIVGGVATISDCAFTENVGLMTSGPGGGAITSEDAQLIVENCQFQGNTSFRGGALSHSGFEGCVIRNSSFVANTATSGGALWLPGSSSIDHCTFTSNAAVGAFQPGGAIAGAVFLRCNRSTFVGNTALLGYGGAVSAAGGHTHLHACRMIANSAGKDGGAVEIGGTGSSVMSCELVANTTTEGASAIKCASLGCIVANCTVVGNSTSLAGGAAILMVTNPSVRVENSILWGNSSGGRSSVDTQVGVSGLGEAFVFGCLIEGLAAIPAEGALNSGVNPLFVDLDGPDNLLGTIDDDCGVADDSPAIDSGIVAAVLSDECDADGDGDTQEFNPHDVLGAPRFASVWAGSGCGSFALVDRGAREKPGRGAVPRRGDATSDGLVDGADLAVYLAAWASPTDPCDPVDVQRNGYVDLYDLVTMLSGLWTGANP